MAATTAIATGTTTAAAAKPAAGPKAQSSGSGFFISADGYIVTNNHVVENAEDIKVTLKDGRILPAPVIGRDEATDLAVIKVEGDDFPFVDFENSAKPRVGDWVIAVGNPFGLGNTATAGIVSAYGRDIGDSFVDFIQIDAPINRGNSGGPTFDIYGRVIGVNSAIFSPSGGSVGIGFAIPADVADNDHQAADRRRQDHPRLHRRHDPERDARHRRKPGHERPQGRAGGRPGARRPGRARPASSPATWWSA